MADDLTSKMTAEGEIREVFAIVGRGQVLVLEEGFRGTIHSNGLVKSDRGTATYTGPEYVDSTISEGKSWIAVIVDPSVNKLFARGQRVTFYSALNP
jgi:hypothetical protein